MTILFDATRPVKSARRPFGSGILPPARPAPSFEPSAEDRAWWAAESARSENARLDEMAAEAEALDRLESGLCL